MALTRFSLSYNARVSAEMGLDRYSSGYVSVRTKEDNDWDVTMSPYQARKLARQLTKAANFIDPPKPRKARS